MEQLPFSIYCFLVFGIFAYAACGFGLALFTKNDRGMRIFDAFLGCAGTIAGVVCIFWPPMVNYIAYLVMAYWVVYLLLGLIIFIFDNHPMEQQS